MRPILAGTQWDQITILLIRRQHRVWPGRYPWRTSRILLERRECAEKEEGSVGVCMWGCGYEVLFLLASR